jgi:hypothetical protein
MDFLGALENHFHLPILEPLLYLITHATLLRIDQRRLRIQSQTESVQHPQHLLASYLRLIVPVHRLTLREDLAKKSEGKWLGSAHSC